MIDTRLMWTMAVALEREHGEETLHALALSVIHASERNDRVAIRTLLEVVRTFASHESQAAAAP
jgi:hypothetical protein